jgi:uncharacterized protein YbcI
MKTKEELEAEVAQAVLRCHKDTFGRGPVEVRVCLLETLAVAHLRQVLTPLEAHLLRQGPGAGGPLLVRELRLRASAPWQEDGLKAAVEAVLGTAVRTLLTDVCPESDEAVYVFPLAAPAQYRTKAGNGSCQEPGGGRKMKHDAQGKMDVRY